MESIGKLTVMVLILVVGFFVSLFGVIVIQSIGSLFELEVINNLSFIQVYGFMTLISIFRYKNQKTDDMEFSERIKEIFTKQTGKVLMLLLTWGFSFIAHYFLT